MRGTGRQATESVMPDQGVRKTAIEDTQRDICLSAGAGSGKTSVLISRLIRLLTGGHAELHQLAAITFTEKAAAELKTRLSQALRQQPLSGRIWQYDLGDAHIGTIHSFCSTLLRENAVEAGIDPGFGVLDEPGRDALSRRLFEVWIEEMLTAAQQGEGLLAPLLASVDLCHAHEMLLDLAGKPLRAQALLDHYARGMADPEETPEHATARTALLAAAAHLLARWQETLDAQGWVDFDGLLGRARDLLRDRAEVRAHYQRQFRFVHIDEFQDVDGVQAELVRLLCGYERNEVGYPPHLFVVGDPQQSIYRFRGAVVDQFVRMAQTIRDRGGLTLRLTQCFRSQARLVGFFNHLFPQVFVPPEGLPETGQIRYAPVDPVRSDDSAAPAVEFLFVPSTESAAKAREQEAEHLARRFRQVLDSGAQVVGERREGQPEGYRATRPGDMAILFRAMTDVGIYEQALRRHGIPFYTVAGSGFFARQEVLDVLNVLRLLLHPHDRLSLAAVLRAPWVGCSDGVLFWVAAEDAWDDLRSTGLRQRIDAEEGRRLDVFLEWFGGLRARRDQLPIAGLIAQLLGHTWYRGVLATQPDGSQALGNLRKLVDLARQFDSGPAASLHSFVAYLEERLAYTPREAEAALELESGDTVKLMSVHQSKGLEWPVVAIADLNRQFQLPGGDSLLWDPAVGMGLKLCDDQLKMEAGTDYRRVQESLVRLELGEQQRVFYVAATRARDRLLLCGAYNPDKFAPSLGAGKSWLQWVGEIHPIGREFSYPMDHRQMPVRTELPPETPPSQSGGRGMAYPELVSQIREQASSTGPDPKGWQTQLVPPVPGGPASRLAVTDLELFSVCPRRYQLRRLLQVPEESGHSALSEEDQEPAEGAPALSIGQVVHQVLHLLPANATAKDLPGLVAATVRQQGMEDARIGPDLERQVVRLLEGWLKTARWQAVRQSTERRGEVPFVQQHANARCLAGRFDLLYRDAAGGWHILDYKTDRVDGSAADHVAANYRLQQEAYGLAADRLLEGEVGEVVFVFLRTGKEVVWRPTPAAVASAQSHLAGMVVSWDNALASGSFEKTEENKHCIRCGYRTLCGR